MNPDTSLDHEADHDADSDFSPDQPLNDASQRRACVPCRASHKKCECEALPCPRCVRMGIPEQCVYGEPKKRGRPRKETRPHIPSSSSSTTAPHASQHIASMDPHSMASLYGNPVMHMNMTPPMVPSIPTSAQSPSNTDWFSTFLQVGHHTDPHAMQPTEGVHSVDEAWARMTGSVPVRVDNLRREASYLRHRVEPENPALSLPIPHDEMLNSPLGVAIWCLWGFLYVNDSWARFLGYTKEELLSGLVFWPQLFPTREMLVRRTGCLAFAFSGDEVHIENPAQFVRKDGSEITCVFTVRAVRDQVGQPVYFVGQLVPLDASMLPSTQHVPRTNTSLLGVLQQQAQAGNNNCAPMMPSMYAYPLQQHQQSQQRQLQHQAQLQMATPTTTYPDAFYLNAPTPDL